MKRKIIQYVAVGVAIVVSGGLCLAIGIDSGTLVAIIVLITSGIAFFVADSMYDSHLSKKNLAESKHMVIDKENNTANMLQRSTISASFLSYEPVYITYTKKHDSKLIYTGATVGGVHTGGFHTTKAYLSDEPQRPSGKYHIYVRYEGGKNVEIEKIKLSPELLAEAKKCKSIKKFIVEDGLKLRYDGEDTKLNASERAILSDAVKDFDTATQYNITQRAYIATLPTLEDCKAIKNWVSGN